jgi:hypothetical protein
MTPNMLPEHTPQVPFAFSPNAFGTPEPVLASHPPDQLDGLFRQRGPVRLVGLGLSSPQQTKPFSMPADNRIRLDEEQGISPPRHDARQEHQQTSLMGTEGGPLLAARRHQKLLTK